MPCISSCGICLSTLVITSVIRKFLLSCIPLSSNTLAMPPLPSGPSIISCSNSAGNVLVSKRLLPRFTFFSHSSIVLLRCVVTYFTFCLSNFINMVACTSDSMSALPAASLSFKPVSSKPLAPLNLPPTSCAPPPTAPSNELNPVCSILYSS